MKFTDAVRSAFRHYAVFTGRASRSEYWYFILFYAVVMFVLSLVDSSGTIAGIFWLAVLVPTLALATRRLHDTDRSGWWQLLGFVPLVGVIILVVWLATRGTAGPNRYGSGVSLPEITG